MEYENQNLRIAKEWLKQAISNKCSEYPIREYIKFIDSLNPIEQDFILLNKGITKLIDVVNRYNLG